MHNKTTQSGDELDLGDFAMHAALLTAAIGGDELAHRACTTGMKMRSRFGDDPNIALAQRLQFLVTL